MWISIEDRFPTEGKVVIIYLNKDNWIYDEDPECIYVDTAWMVKGISQTERSQLKDEKAARTYRQGDEWGNNKRAYAWDTFGPSNYFGQEVTHWMEIPELPKRG